MFNGMNVSIIDMMELIVVETADHIVISRDG